MKDLLLHLAAAARGQGRVWLAHAAPGPAARHAGAPARPGRPGGAAHRRRQVGRLPGAGEHCCDGPTIVISPLLALQHDQIAALNARGRRGAARGPAQLGPDPASSRPRRWRRSGAATARLLFITPEQLARRPGWPSARRCARRWSRSTRRTACPAGATTSGPTTWRSGRADPERDCGRPPDRGADRDRLAAGARGHRGPARPARPAQVVIGGLDRPNLFLEAVHCPTEEHRWRRLLDAARRQATAPASSTCRPGAPPRS